MKKLAINLTLLAALSGLFLSCSSERYGPPADGPEERTSESSMHAVPIDTAIANLYSFLSEINPESTKSAAEQKTISSVSPIKLSSIKTKSDIEEPDVDNLVYLINFENNGGYAMVAADDRIEEDVLMYIESGSLSEEELIDACAEGDSSATFQGYPTTGPGIITDEDGQKYINPNTFEPYDEESGDTYIGDFTMEDGSDSSKVKVTVRAMIPLTFEYAQNEITRTDSGNRLDNDSEEIVEKYELGETIKSVRVQPMLAQFSFWGQDYPFNRYSPTVRKWLLLGESRLADAGCVPLAIAKILAYIRFPEYLAINGVAIDWNSMSVNDTQCESAARLIRWVGECSYSLYTWNYTATLPSLSANFLANDMHFNNVEYCDYDTAEVTKMLDKGCPLFVSSLPRLGPLSFDFANAHGWNIDGYYLKKYDRTTNYYKNGILSTPSPRPFPLYMCTATSDGEAGTMATLSPAFSI